MPSAPPSPERCNRRKATDDSGDGHIFTDAQAASHQAHYL